MMAVGRRVVSEEDQSRRRAAATQDQGLDHRESSSASATVAASAAVGASAQSGGSRYVFGFHRPPFTSVQHLHMHSIATPFVFGHGWRFSWLTPFSFVGAVAAAERLKARLAVLRR